MKSTALCLALILAGVSACAATFDGVYALGDGKTHETAPDSSPTGHTVSRTEYEAALVPNAGLQLRCFDRERQVERSWSVSKTYEYRGGFEAGSYYGAAIADGVIGALVAGTLLGICTNEDSELSCMNMLWASPFAVDLVYGLIRARSVGPKVLVDKQRSGDQMRYSESALSERETQCGSVSGLYVGSSTGPSDAARLNGNSSGETRELNPDALQLGFDELGNIVLSPEVTAYWGSRSYASLWIRDDKGALQAVSVDRCTTLRPHASTMGYQERQSFDRDCPLPQPTQ